MKLKHSSFLNCFYRKYGKRLLDILLSLILMPPALTIILICGIFIRLDDGGPVFYCGKRLGKDGKTFTMFKLRTMKVNSPDIRTADGSTWNSDDDPRVTKPGKLLRKSSLDEVPQIFNVLAGDMSFVGPRPDTTDSLEKYTPDECRRLSVLPGITGYTQAYYRNSIDAREKIIKDVFYVEHMSLFFDSRIFLKTLVSIFLHKNIYTC